MKNQSMVLLWKRRWTWLYEQKGGDRRILKRIRLPERIRKPDNVIECYWALPPAHWAKVNVDGAANGAPGPSGWGSVIKNDRGDLLAAGTGGIEIATSFVAESVAIIQGINQATIMGMKNIWVESDCEAAIQSFQADIVHWCVKLDWDLIKASNANLIFSVNKREVNFAVDRCSKIGALMDKGQKQWWLGAPPFFLPLENHNATYYHFVKG